MEYLIVPFDSALQYESNIYHISFYLSPHPTKTQFSWHVPMFSQNVKYVQPKREVCYEILRGKVGMVKRGKILPVGLEK